MLKICKKGNKGSFEERGECAYIATESTDSTELGWNAHMTYSTYQSVSCLLPPTVTLMITFSFTLQAKFPAKFNPTLTNTGHVDVSWSRIQFCWLGWKCKRTSVCRVAKGKWWSLHAYPWQVFSGTNYHDLTWLHIF